MIPTILDIGCGAHPMGDVNLDRYVGEAIDHRLLSELSLNPKYIPRFVLGDTEYLPFNDNSFDTVRASHLLEHINNPFRVLQEMKRVSSKHIVIILPSAHRLDAKRGHVYSWTKRAFEHLLNRADIKIIHSRVSLKISFGLLRSWKWGVILEILGVWLHIPWEYIFICEIGD